MKICLFLLFAFAFQLMATNTNAQDAIIELRSNSVTVSQLISEIEKQTDYLVVYSNREVNTSRTVSLKNKSDKVSEYLNQTFSGTDIGYDFEKNYIVLSKKEKKNTNSILSIIKESQQQKKNITGTVVDTSGIPIIGANIVEARTTNGTITDIDGNFSLDVGDNALIHISYIGYLTQEILVNSQTNFIIQLEEDMKRLEEVIVLGYGATTRRKDLSAAIGIVADPEKLATHPVTSTEAMLQGQLPGVTVTSNGGSPATTPNIVIRGQGSQNGDNVLWVVDGVPGAPINSLSDIESIIVLKDAASAAIYGAQSGAGGVILVTTKKGREGVSVSYDGLVGVRSATNLVQSLDAEQQIRMRTISHANAGLDLPIGWDTTRNPWIGTTRTDWVDEIFRDAVYHRHNVVLNSGTGIFKNRVSFTSEINDGVLVGTYSKNLGVQYRGDVQVNKWIKITENLNWKQADSRGTDTDSGYSGAIISAIYMPQSAAKYQYDGTGYGGTTTEDPAYIGQYGSNFGNIHGDVINPLRSLLADTRYNRNINFFNTVGLEVTNIVPGLKFSSKFSYYTNQGLYRNFNPMRPEIGKPSLSNNLSYSTNKSSGWKTENTLIYDNTFGKHTVGGLVSTTADYYEARGFSASASNFSDETDFMQYFNFAGEWTKPSDYLTGPDANVALISRASYSYDDRYFVTASWRRDYAGRLPDGNNYGDFPAFTGAWKISKEAFFNVDLISMLKLRASWGRVGNLGSIGYNYKSPTLTAVGPRDQSAQYGFESSAGYVGTYYYNGKALNPNLTWETSEQSNIGIDLDLFNDRLSMSYDFYNKRTYNLIQTQSMGWPESIGLSAMLVNMGEVMNRGFEVQIGWDEQVNKNLSYYINGNLGYNKNWVSDIGVKDDSGNAGVWTGGGAFRNVPDIYQTAEGEPLGSYYMIKYLGIFQSDEEANAYVNSDGNKIQPEAKAGDLKFEDYNGDGKIDSNDRQYLGNAVPNFTFALSAGLTWKDFGLSMMFQGVQGAQSAYMAKYSILSDVEGNFNRSVDILDAWSSSNTGSNIPRLSKNDPNQNFSRPSSWYLEDASYLRLKNVTLSYDVTNAIRKRSHFLDRGSSLMVYLSGENLFTITPYSGMDPETGGWDGLKYPVSRVLSVGVKLTY